MASERGRSANTLAAYRRDLAGYAAWLSEHGGRRRIGGPRRRSTGSCRRGTRVGRAPSSVARQLAAVRMLHRFMAEEGMRADDPTADVEGVRVPAGIPHPLTEAEVEQLLGCRGRQRPVSLRDRALLEFLYATGARISEACGLSLGDLDRDNRVVRLFGKGAKERLVPFGRSAATAHGRVAGTRGANTSSRRGGLDAATRRRCS